MGNKRRKQALRKATVKHTLNICRKSHTQSSSNHSQKEALLDANNRVRERERGEGGKEEWREREGERRGRAYLWKNLCKLPREKMSSYDAKESQQWPEIDDGSLKEVIVILILWVRNSYLIVLKTHSLLNRREYGNSRLVSVRSWNQGHILPLH